MQAKLVEQPKEKRIELILGLMEQLGVSASDLHKKPELSLPISAFNTYCCL